MDTIFLSSKNSKTSEPLRVILNITDEINLKSFEKYVVLSNLIIYCTWKNINKCTWKNINKSYINKQYQLQSGMINFINLMDRILYYIFKTISSISSKNMKQ